MRKKLCLPMPRPNGRRNSYAREIHLRDRRRGLRIGQGDHCRLFGPSAQAEGIAGEGPEAGPLPERGPRHHEPLPARGGLRHRRRRGDGPGPGPLRALHRRESGCQLLCLRRKNLLGRPQPGAPGGLPRGHGPDHPPHHRGDQAPHLLSGRAGGGRRHRGDRRHRWGHREPALPGGHPAGGRGAGAAQRHVPPRLPRRRHPRHRGAQEQAHPALRQGAFEHRHPAGRDPLPLRRAGAPGYPGEDLPLLQHPRGPRHPEPDGGSPLRGAADAGAGGACGGGGAAAGAHLPHAGPHRVGHHGPPGQAPGGGGGDRPGGQVCGPP